MTPIAPTRRQVLTGTAVAALSAPFAASAAQAKPHRVDFAVAGIDRSLTGLIDNGAVGATASVVGPGGTYVQAAGRRDFQKGKALTQDRAHVASVTKAMIAVLVMQRIEAGQWTLRTTIDQVAPGLYPGRGGVTVSQLMNHTSGMPDGIQVLLGDVMPNELTRARLESVINRQYTERRLVALSRQLPWAFEPGTAWQYSNAGYVVLSVMLEEATGTGLSELIRSHVFKPAGMRSARLEDSPLVRGRHLVPHAYLVDGLTPLPRVNPSIFSGAGAVYATAEDVTSFTGALMTGQLLPQELVDVMITPVGPKTPLNYGYGLYQTPGVCLTPEGTLETLIGHDGAGFGTLALSFTTRDGSRRAAVAWTGRSYLSTGPFPNGNDVVVAGFAATCPDGRRVGRAANMAHAVATGRAEFRL